MTSPMNWSFRTRYLLGFLASFGLIGFAVYLQEARGLMPCSFCILQRVAFAALGLVFLIGGLHAPRSRGGRKAYGVLVGIAALVGVAIAGRHVWVQVFPPQLSTCGGGLEFLAAMNGWAGAIRKVLTASGDCSNVEYFMGVSIPIWALVWFVALGAWGLWTAYGKERAR